MCAMIATMSAPATPLAQQDQSFLGGFLSQIGTATKDAVSSGIARVGQAGTERLVSKISSEASRLGKTPNSSDDLLRTPSKAFDTGDNIDRDGFPLNTAGTPGVRVLPTPKGATGKSFDLGGLGINGLGVSPTLLVLGGVVLVGAFLLSRK